MLLAFDEVRGVTMRLFKGEQRDLSLFDETEIADISSDGNTVLLSETGEVNEGWASVYLKRIDGSPAVRLGDGFARSLSEDGRYALATQPEKSRLVLFPTGVGETLFFSIGDFINDHTFPFPNLSPDARSIVFMGKEKGHAIRVYIQDVSGGKPRPITEEGVDCFSGTHSGCPISPDGKFFVARSREHEVYVYPVDGGERTKVIGILDTETPFQWSKDGKSIYVFKSDVLPVEIHRLNPLSGQRTLLKN